MSKYIALKKNEMCISALDLHSFYHVCVGIVMYIIGYKILSIYIIDIISCLSMYIILCLGSLSFEFIENSCLVYMKPDNKQDSALNTICDTLIVILGGFIGNIIYMWF